MNVYTMLVKSPSFCHRASPSCHSVMHCPLDWSPVCGSDGLTYASVCDLKAKACQTQTKVEVKHEGTCRKGGRGYLKYHLSKTVSFVDPQMVRLPFRMMSARTVLTIRRWQTKTLVTLTALKKFTGIKNPPVSLRVFLQQNRTFTERRYRAVYGNFLFHT